MQTTHLFHQNLFLEEKVLKPLGTGDTGFRPSTELLGRIAPTEVDTIFRGIHVHGVVHDENAYAIGLSLIHI